MNMNEQNYLLNIDSIVGMKSIADKTVNLVLTDPPYGIANASKITKVCGQIVSTNEAWGNDFKDSWDSVEDYWLWFKPFITEFERVMKDGSSMILFLDRKYTGLITHYIESDFELQFKNKIYFSKLNPMPSIRKNNYRSKIEEAVWFTKGKQYTFNFGEQCDMTQVYQGPIGKKKTKHPAEKYGWMMEPLIRNHTKPGDIVLDAFAGSGSTLVHAIQNQRRAIGFEKNTQFFDMAKVRAESEQLQLIFE
jgi:site-specific DNA-methyltransferase (adenine-specific)